MNILAAVLNRRLLKRPVRHEALRCATRLIAARNWQAASPRHSWFDEQTASGLNYALTAKMYL